MIKDNRVVMCIYDKRAASYDVILLAMTADEYRKAAAATRRQTVSAAHGQPNNDPKPQWKLQGITISQPTQSMNQPNH